jgi:hypothetical protein
MDNQTRLVLIEWVDSRGASPRWDFMEDKDHGIVKCQSVGWLVYDGKDAKTVVPHLGSINRGSPQGCGDMTIPAQAIVNISNLRVPPSKRYKKG